MDEKVPKYISKYKYLSPMEVWKEYKLNGKHPIYDDKANYIF